MAFSLLDEGIVTPSSIAIRNVTCDQIMGTVSNLFARNDESIGPARSQPIADLAEAPSRQRTEKEGHQKGMRTNPRVGNR